MTNQLVAKAAFAGGCFWCMVKPFKEWDGIIDVVSGYMGGHVENPTYEDVKKGDSGHLEVVEITFDPAVFPYEKLLDIFWQQIDPTDADGQFHDRGYSYSTAIFYYSDEHRKIAEHSKANLAASGRFNKPIVTPIRPAETFYRAEEYHQDYYIKEKEHYAEDRARSGRDEFIEQHWS
ncbi:peptide-methionine (S)-S-oxide reductase MsrA [Sporosarcina pasteurii]|uniref:Peptide methionine sulfoxide reductase MsrA n=2 Tax=Sporosarcina pasteurii TaxID=1474 RepID=A0A380BTJ9_SPOPA|nr:peptide-methionine (S)-S-oxide reductase MsrA [Sporosarcina pasteurii]MDS9471214.1 peptide-methionine (S)-S-oxide reductase MsrA [Sporosarcina pasteurii]SUJ05689.1 Peptide methionine sulfoxide reductase MsrA [Sporosarcina pasteurii]